MNFIMPNNSAEEKHAESSVNHFNASKYCLENISSVFFSCLWLHEKKDVEAFQLQDESKI